MPALRARRRIRRHTAERVKRPVSLRPQKQRASGPLGEVGLEGVDGNCAKASVERLPPLRVRRSTRWPGLVGEVLDDTASASETRNPL
jgi:hypothetical protein